MTYEIPPRRITRRHALGIVGAGILSGCATSQVARPAIATPDARCTIAPSLTQGPFWVDEKLERSDVTTDSLDFGGDPRPGLPLTLRLAISANVNGQCVPVAGAQVDLWHCDAQGSYSDSDNMGELDTRGHRFLRGFQVTDSVGVVTFRTIYPGWYRGRTVHMHVKVRRFDPQRRVTTEATTQLFFDDAISDEVFAKGFAYKRADVRDTRNADDAIYGGHTSLLLSLKVSTDEHVTATAAIAIELDRVQKDEGPPGPPPFGEGPRRRDQNAK